MAISKGLIGNALSSTADNRVVATADAIYDNTYGETIPSGKEFDATSDPNYLNNINKDLKTRVTTLEGKTVTWNSITGKPTIMAITNNGVVEGGRYYDFHTGTYGSNTAQDYTVRLDAGTDDTISNVFTFPDKSCKLGNVTGPSTPVMDKEVPVFDGTTGRIIKGSARVLGNAQSNIPISNGVTNVSLVADKLDGYDALGNTGNVLVKSGFAHSSTADLASYWSKLADFTLVGTEDHDITLFLHSAYNQLWAFLSIDIRTTATSYYTKLKILSGNVPADRIRLYRDGDPGTLFELWVNTNARYGVLNAKVIAETVRSGSERRDIVTLNKDNFTEVQTPTLEHYIEASYLTLLNPATTATKLATARKITFSGDTTIVNGSDDYVTFDGSKDVTIPIKTNASSLKNIGAVENINLYTNVYYRRGNDFVKGGNEVSDLFSVPENSVDANNKNGLLLRLYWSSNYYTDIFTSPNNHGTKTGLFYRLRIASTMGNWRMLLDNYNYKNVMDTASSTSNGLMSNSDYGALQELIAKTISVSISGTGARFSGVAGNISTSISKLSSLEVSKLELLSGTTNNPTTVLNTYTDKATSKSVSVSPTATTYYRWRATINDKTYQSSVGTVTIVSPIYMGFGDTAAAVKVDANKHTTAVTSAKNLTLSRTNSTNKQTSLYLLIPTSITQPASIKSGGAPVAFTKDTTSVSGYTTYKLGALYNNGTVASVELS